MAPNMNLNCCWIITQSQGDEHQEEEDGEELRHPLELADGRRVRDEGQARAAGGLEMEHAITLCPFGILNFSSTKLNRGDGCTHIVELLFDAAERHVLHGDLQVKVDL